MQSKIHFFIILFTSICFSTNSIAQSCVNDTTPPTMVCQNITVQLSASGVVTVPAQTLDNGSTDNCSIVSFLINGQSNMVYSCANTTPAIAVLTAIDSFGNSSTCAATITVQDFTPPVTACKNATVQLNANGIATVTPQTIDNGSTDNCVIASFLINGSSSISYSCADLGPNAAALTVTDIDGNNSSCVANITVVDNMVPQVVCKDTVWANNATATDSFCANDIIITATDNCSIMSSVISSHPSCVVIPQGSTNTVNATVTVVDASGNSNSCSSVIVPAIVSDVTSIEAPFAFKMFPNPTAGKVTLQAEASIEQVLVYNLAGSLVYNQNIAQQNNVNLNLNHLPQGNYIINVITDKGSAHQKLSLK